MRRTRLAAAAMIAAGALTLAACQADTGEPTDGDDQTTAADDDGAGEDEGDDGGADGTIRIGIKFDQPGVGFQDGDTYTGFDVDVATYVADALGYSEDQIEWVKSPSPQRETMLENSQVDMIVASYSITDEREEVVDFAGPYFVAGQDLLIRADDEGDITGPESLGGLNLCSVAGSTSAQRIQDEYASDVQLIEQEGYSECVQYLIQGQVDAITTDDIILAGLAADEGSGSMVVVGNPFSEEPYGIGLPPGSDNCEPINEALQAMVDDGSWQQFIDDNTAGTGYTPNADVNPPELQGCSS